MSMLYRVVYIYATTNGTIIASTRTMAITAAAILIVFLFLNILIPFCPVRTHEVMYMQSLFVTASIKNLGPVILLCFLIVCFEVLYHKKRSDRRNADADRKFWQREHESNAVRKKDITYLNYIEIPLDTLPMQDFGDEEVSGYQEVLRTLSTARILNLTGMTNTELKLEYGPANLAAITEYEENYVRLISTLTAMGGRLIDIGYSAEAVTILRYAVSIGCEIGRCYYMLATEYRKSGNPELIDELIDEAGRLSTINAPAIIERLKDIRSYCN